MQPITRFPLAERFVAPQGEGLYSGCVMSFLRTVGCSVGKGVCTACDTAFDKSYPELGGGVYTAEEIVEWVRQESTEHVCVSGGEPLDRNLVPLLLALRAAGRQAHIETSGTVKPEWLDVAPSARPEGHHRILAPQQDAAAVWTDMPLWITVSPKPGYLREMVEGVADELKVIIGGLGNGPGWPGIDDALRWAGMGKLVFIQPRNGILDIDRNNLNEALAVVAKHPQLRLSVQMHKFVRTR